jgi:alpha-L-rhamnosidase
MASALGLTSDAEKYTAMFETGKAEFHKSWWNDTAQVYADGGQTAHSLALALDCSPTAAIKKAAVEHLVSDIISHGNHTTCGIIGWRFQPEALSKNGHADLAYALMTQTTYPSIGYEILDPKGEPATTLWELWNSDNQGPGMNSRNHIMVGAARAEFLPFSLHSFAFVFCITRWSCAFQCLIMPCDRCPSVVRGQRHLAAYLHRRHRQRTGLDRL